jgi:hypothetical protein
LINTTLAGTGTVPFYTPATATAKEATAKQATAVGYEPATFEVKPEQTVQEHIRRVIGENSPLLQQAEARARQLVNARGLLNSSIAVGEGQKALYDTALPIAAADAQAYERAATNTTNALLASRAFKAGAENTVSQTNAALGTDVSKANAALGTDVAKTNAAAKNAALAQGADAALRQVLQTADNDTKLLLQSMSDMAALTRTRLTAGTQLQIAQIDQETKQYLGRLDANNRQLLQTNASLTNMFQETVKNIAAIAADQTMTPDAKNAATTTQLNLLNEALRAAQAVATTDQQAIQGLDLGQYFSGWFGSTGGAPSGGPASGGPSGSSGGAPSGIPGGGGEGIGRDGLLGILRLRDDRTDSRSPDAKYRIFVAQGFPADVVREYLESTYDWTAPSGTPSGRSEGIGRDGLLNLLRNLGAQSTAGPGQQYRSFVDQGFPVDAVREYLESVYGPPRFDPGSNWGGYPQPVH